MEAFWEAFELEYRQSVRLLRGKRRQRPLTCAGVMRLSPDAEENDLLLAEILSGQRTAYIDTLSNLQRLGRPIMGNGEYYVLVDSSEAPRCVLQTTGAHFTAFREMKAEWAQMEGAEPTLQAWQSRWRSILMQDAQALGVPLSLEEMMVVETFRVVYRPKEA